MYQFSLCGNLLKSYFNRLCDELIIRLLIQITPRDKRIMQFVANGFTALQIADKIGLSKKTVEHRILILRKKLNSKSITHLAITLLRAKVIK